MERIGGRVLAISTDAPADSARVVQRNRLGFSILSDKDGTAMEAYGVKHAGGGPDGSDIAIPSYFLINRDGVIVWRRVSQRVQDRPSPDEAIAEIRRLGP